ncbi:MAG: ATP-binding protein [Rubricoccaceae bacterium]
MRPSRPRLFASEPDYAGSKKPIPLPVPLQNRLQDIRHAHFVGRRAELERFQQILEGTSSTQVLFVYGPGGVGKTSLLHEFAFACTEAGIPVGRLDARMLDATPEALETAFQAAEPNGAQRHVLLVDTLERIHALDDWLRDVLLPSLSDTLILVLSGRRKPNSSWQIDPGWADLVETMPLRNLSSVESRAFLLDRGVLESQHERIVEFARGYPLALALAAETLRDQPDASFDPIADRQTVAPLLNRFLNHVEPDVRDIVETCSLVRVATEPLLSRLLGRPVSRQLFDRVRQLPIVEDAATGIALHDLALDVIAADLRWRAPDHYAQLHELARQAYTDRLRNAETPAVQREALADYAFLYRHAPVAGPLIGTIRDAIRGSGSLTMGPAEANDLPALVEMTEQHEGPEAARLVGHWFERQPDRFTCVFDADGTPAGFLLSLALDRASSEDRKVDPLAAAAWTSLRLAAPRDGERVLLFRFWMDREQHQGVSPVQALLFARTVWDYLSTPDLAVSLLACVAPHPWEPILGFAGLSRQPEADADVDGVRYEVFAHDWRTEPQDVWLEALADQTPLAIVNPAETPEPPPLVVLNEADFREAAKNAIKGLAHPELLLESNLLHSRLVAEHVDADADDIDRAQALDMLVREAIASIATIKKGTRYHAALETMFIRPAPSQAIAAERLDLPFSTFRRHLARGIDRVVDALWAMETR